MKIVITAILIAILMLCSCSGQDAADLTQASSSPVECVTAAPVSPSETAVQTAEPTEEAEEYEGNIIADYCLQFEGYKYVYGAESPEDGFDCSGLVYYVYKQHGYKLYRVTYDQVNQGTKIDSVDDILPGDLVCFKKGSTCTHIGIYLGNDRFIHSYDSATGVIISSLDSFSKCYGLEIRRIVGSMEKKTIEQIEEEEAVEAELLAEALRLKALQASPSPVPTPESDSEDSSEEGLYVLPSPTSAPEPSPDTPSEDDDSQQESSSSEQSNSQQESNPSEESNPAEQQQSTEAESSQPSESTDGGSTGETVSE